MMNAPVSVTVIDGHNDLPWRLRTEHGGDVRGFDTGWPEFATDGPRLTRGGVAGQFWSVWVDPDLGAERQVEATFEQISLVHRLVDAYPDHLRMAWCAADIRAAWRDGLLACMIGVEGAEQLNGSISQLHDAARRGARYVTLTWSRTTPWADSATDASRHGGLAPAGADFVYEMNRIGLLIDLAHVAPTTMRDALDITDKPVIVSHSGARAVCDHPRNVPDDVIERIGSTGGVHMVTFVPSFLTEDRRAWVNSGEEGNPPPVTIANVADHMDHVRQVAGIHAVGIGSDFDGTDSYPLGLEDVSCYPGLFAELRSRGWSSADCQAAAHGNILRVIEDNDPAYRAFLRDLPPARKDASS